MEAGRTDTMKPDKQRIAIAEYCGWAGFEVTGHILLGVPPQNEITEKLLGPKTITGWTPRFDVPDYPNDLNAMHEAEKSLALPYRKQAYWLHLTEVCEPSKEYWRATAAQRAEAFLRTIEKWEE